MRNRKMTGMRHSVFARQSYSIGAGLMLLFFLAWSCKKSDKQSYPKDYHFKSISVEGPTRVFSNGAEITDEKVKKDFIGSLEYFFVDINEKDENLKFSFVSDTTVFFQLTEPYHYKKAGNTFIFTGKRGYYIDLQEFNRFQLWKHRGEPEPDPNGYMVKPVFVAYGNIRELSLPYTAYKLMRTTRYNGAIVSMSMQAGTLYNEFNEESIKALRIGDTLAIRSYMGHFEAKPVLFQ